MFINDIIFRWDRLEEENYYSRMPVLRNTDLLKLDKSVTFFVGENGTGKSTLLEAIAIAYGFNAEGGSLNHNFASKNTHSDFHKYLTLSKSAYRPTEGFFLRAESFYNLATEIDNLDSTESIFHDDCSKFMDNYGGMSLHCQSHGESVLSLIQNRFRGNGIYILDEPETALSPQRQLTLLYEIFNLVNRDSQFIIVTHSPILLGIPNARIYSFDNSSILSISYEDTDAYKITKVFLQDKRSVLNKLLEL